MNLTLTIVYKTKKTNKLYYTGDDPILTDPLPPLAQVLGVAVTEGYRIRVRILRTTRLICTPINPKTLCIVLALHFMLFVLTLIGM